MVFKDEIRCLILYGTTSFGLLEKYGISIMRWSEEQQAITGAKAYSACSGELYFDYGHNGTWANGDTPFEALINCVAEIERLRSPVNAERPV